MCQKNESVPNKGIDPRHILTGLAVVMIHLLAVGFEFTIKF